uniref:Myb-like domain-containing protein n=1 Tax=Oryza brachyantha TaxID=4533 RepID=J3N0Q6_ORYBR
MDFHPPGGFLSYFQDPSILQNHQPYVPPNYYSVQQVAPCSEQFYSPTKTNLPCSTSGPGAQHLVNIDSGGEEAPAVRTEKRLTWSQEEDIRLVSAWLKNSNDLISGNFKKNDRYWGVTAAYNSTTPKNRTRQEKQIKDRFHKIKKNVGHFCCAWKEVKSIYVSGQNDMQLREKAEAAYEADYK